MSGLGAIIDTGRRLADRAEADGTTTGRRHATEWQSADVYEVDRLRAALDHLVATRREALAATRAWEVLDAGRGAVYGVGDQEDHGDLDEQRWRWEAARRRMDDAHDRWLAAAVAVGVAAGAAE